MVEKDLEKHKWRRRLKRRNSMNQRASVLLNRYCMFIMKELEAGTEFLDKKIDQNTSTMKDQIYKGF